MLFTGSSAMKHIKYLEEEKTMLLQKERNNSTTVEVDGKVREVECYNFQATRESIRELDAKICKLRHALNVFNTHTEIEEGLTIDTALIKLAQLNNELSIVRDMKSKAKESVEERYSNMYIRRVNYDLREVENYYQDLVKEIHQLQIKLDTANLTNTFEVDI